MYRDIMSIYREPPPGMCIVPDKDDMTKVRNVYLWINSIENLYIWHKPGRQIKGSKKFHCTGKYCFISLIWSYTIYILGHRSQFFLALILKRYQLFNIWLFWACFRGSFDIVNNGIKISSSFSRFLLIDFRSFNHITTIFVANCGLFLGMKSIPLPSHQGGIRIHLYRVE